MPLDDVLRAGSGVQKAPGIPALRHSPAQADDFHPACKYFLVLCLPQLDDFVNLSPLESGFTAKTRTERQSLLPLRL